MITFRNLVRTVAGCSLVAAGLAPALVGAQTDVRSSNVPGYHLVQLEVAKSVVSLEAFEASTGAIASCEDAGDVARELDAAFTRNRFVRASQLPDALQEILAELPAGKATPVFSNDGETLRVLVLCARA